MSEYSGVNGSVELLYYESKLQHLVGQEVAEIFRIDYLLSIIALLFSVGAMVIAYFQSYKESEQTISLCGLSPALIVVVLILVSVLGYATYAQFKHSQNKKELPRLIKETKEKIESLKRKEVIK